MKPLIGVLIACSLPAVADAADISVERIYWLPNHGGKDVAILYDGGVKKGDFTKLTKAKRMVEKAGKTVTALWLNSWGGDGDTGMMLAYWVSKNDIDVFVDNQCVSACAFAALVALGRGRLLITDDADIGVHQVTDNSTGKADLAWTRAAANELAKLGAPREPLNQMCEQSPNGMRLFSPTLMAAFGARVMEQPFRWTWW